MVRQGRVGVRAMHNVGCTTREQGRVRALKGRVRDGFGDGLAARNSLHQHNKMAVGTDRDGFLVYSPYMRAGLGKGSDPSLVVPARPFEQAGSSERNEREAGHGEG